MWISGGGMIFHWDGAEWTPADTGDAGLRDIGVTDDDTDGYAVCGGGKVYDLGDRWVEESTPTGENLKAVARGPVDVAVGAAGTGIEH